MPELSLLVKISIALYFLCPITAVLIYFSPLWKKICEKFDEDVEEETTDGGH